MGFSKRNTWAIGSMIAFQFIHLLLCNAQSPSDLSTNILWEDTGGVYNPSSGQFSATFNGIADIEAAFNNGRRAEEIQIGLPANTLGNLVLPASYDLWTINEKGMYILNAERATRGGQNYGNGSVLGLMIEALEDNLTTISEWHAQDMVDNNSFSHIDSNGKSSFKRIDDDPVLGNSTGCHEYIDYAENLAGYWTAASSVPLSLERSIYDWIYRDAGPGWGHRRMMLIQDIDNGGKIGFNNNHDDGGHEGFVAFAIAGANHGAYNPFGFTYGVDRGEVVVMNIVDPVDNNCNYQKSAVLPVELGEFSGQQLENTIQLNWITTTELNNDYFLIERSGDGQQFIPIGEVDGNGTTNEPHAYYFLDEQPLNNTNYYRLRSIDFDGSEKVYQIIVQRMIRQLEIGLFPNPVLEELRINYNTAKHGLVTVQINNITGQSVMEQTFKARSGNNLFYLNLSELNMGMYVIECKQGQVQKSLHFVKE